MPTYDYECTECGHVFEKFHSIMDEPEKVCPQCGGLVKRRIGTGGGIIFKGGGFYSTDYRSKEYKDKAKSESSSSSGSSDKSSGSPDAKSGSDAAKPAQKDSGSSSEPKKPSGS